MSRVLIACFLLCFVVCGVRGKSLSPEGFLKTIEGNLFTEKTCEGFEWNGLCFWYNNKIPTVVTQSSHVTEHTGVPPNCGDDGHPANIYNEEHYKLLMKYLRTKINIEISDIIDWIMVYTGMTFDPLTKVLSYSNGETASFTSWHPGLPLTGSDNSELTGLEILVSLNPDEPRQGMLNNLPRGLNQIVCERQINK